MKKIRNIVAIIFILALVGLRPSHAYAQDEAGSAAQLAMHTGFGALMDTRGAHLRSFLNSYNSPMADDADAFIAEADRYDLDWRLVAAIAGTESTFGKHVPPGSYNGWGWGIPTGAQSGLGFDSWKDGIHAVSKGLKTNYINRGAMTLDQIGAIYAASPVWSAHVQFFINKIDEYKPLDASVLSVTI